MSKINKILLAILVLIVIFFGSNVFKKINKQYSKTNKTNMTNNSNKLEKNLNTQENEGGNVTVIVKPKILKVGKNPTFELEFETHSVDLSFDVIEQSYLVDDEGNRFDNGIWEGSPPGGHHREGTLIFNEVLSKTKFVKLIVRNVSDIPERTFRWEL